MAKNKLVTVITKDENANMGCEAHVTINNPPVNSISSKVLGELSQIFEDLDERRDVHEVHLYGAGKHFSAGADIQELKSIASCRDDKELRDCAYAFSKRGQRLILQILSMSASTPVYAHLNGATTGGGLELALACHTRTSVSLISERPFMCGLPEVTLGVIPGWGGTALLPLIIGPQRFGLDIAEDLISHGKLITGRFANNFNILRDGSKEDNIPDLIKQKTVSPHALALVSEAFMDRELSWDTNKIAQALDQETKLFVRAMAHPDAEEGITAFLEKREPKFK